MTWPTSAAVELAIDPPNNLNKEGPYCCFHPREVVGPCPPRRQHNTSSSRATSSISFPKVFDSSRGHTTAPKPATPTTTPPPQAIPAGGGGGGARDEAGPVAQAGGGPAAAARALEKKKKKKSPDAGKKHSKAAARGSSRGWIRTLTSRRLEHHADQAWYFCGQWSSDRMSAVPPALNALHRSLFAHDAAASKKSKTSAAAAARGDPGRALRALVTRALTVRRTSPLDLPHLLLASPAAVHLSRPTSRHAWHILTLGLGTRNFKAAVFVFESAAMKLAMRLPLGDVVGRRLIHAAPGALQDLLRRASGLQQSAKPH
ncbi:hypothetical protein HU200_035596 [Digitaria exilis]|uniref:DUF7851 domain-containing protein n=1 Tax=Digitaria exilis TaxID=1010633 RepID=A0A835BID8_9POAL|nr:hypothetical protein HU200_035596 [Digitaria exilis]